VASAAHDPWQANRNDGLAFVASIGATATVLGWIAGLPFEALRLPAGLFVGLFAPGYLLLRASVGPRVEGALRFVLPVPLTLAMAAVFGVALDQTSHGVRENALGVSLCVFSLGLAVVAFIRGTHPVTFRARDMRPSLLDVLRGPLRPPRYATADLPPIASDLAISASVLVALAAAGLWISRSIDLSTDRVGSVALTGRVQAAAQPRDGMVRAGVELTVENDRPGPITGILRIAVEPAGQARKFEQRLTVPANATSRVAVSLAMPCEGAVRATLSHPSGAGRAVRLRVRCPPAS
jgi:Protein of unknown function (DUF1616)